MLKIHHIPPPPTKNQAKLPSLSTHPQASSVQKKSLPGAGGVFLAKGERELEVAEAVRQEAMQQPARANERAAQQVATRLPDGTSKGDGALRGCGTTRSHATTNRVSGRQRHVKRWQRWQRRLQKSGNGGLDNNQVKSGKTVVGVVAEAEADVGEN